MVTTARTRGGYTPGELTVHTSPAAISPVTRALRSAGRRIALVPTMGALHEGHRELIRHARRMPGAGVVVVSIFVNPLQFGPAEDLSRYPRPLDTDLQICRDDGVELVFAPGVDDMYPAGAATTIRTTAAISQRSVVGLAYCSTRVPICAAATAKIAMGITSAQLALRIAL